MTDSHPHPPAAATPATPPLPPISTDISPATHPDEYHWLPVPRDRRRWDGWTVLKQRDFIGAIADLGSIRRAAESVGMSEASAYRLRRAPGAEHFAHAWDVAVDEARHRVLAHALDRVVNGDEIEVRNRDGGITGYTRRYPDRLTMFMLRGYFPQRFGPLHAGAGTALPTPEIRVERALDALLPPVPEDAHLQMDPEALHGLAHGGDNGTDVDENAGGDSG